MGDMNIGEADQVVQMLKEQVLMDQHCANILILFLRSGKKLKRRTTVSPLFLCILRKIIFE